MASTRSGPGAGGVSAAPVREGGRFGRRGARTGAPPSSFPGSSRNERAILSPGESAGGRGLDFGATGTGAPASTGVELFRRVRCSGVSAVRFSCLRSRLRLLARFCPTRQQVSSVGVSLGTLGQQRFLPPEMRFRPATSPGDRAQIRGRVCRQDSGRHWQPRCTGKARRLSTLLAAGSPRHRAHCSCTARRGRPRAVQPRSSPRLPLWRPSTL